jgi:hypothetical protein
MSSALTHEVWKSPHLAGFSGREAGKDLVMSQLKSGGKAVITRSSNPDRIGAEVVLRERFKFLRPELLDHPPCWLVSIDGVLTWAYEINLAPAPDQSPATSTDLAADQESLNGVNAMCSDATGAADQDSASMNRLIDVAVEKALRRREKDWPLVVRSV